MKHLKQLSIVAGLTSAAILAALVFLPVGQAHATLLSANRDTPAIIAPIKKISLTVKNDEVIYAGAMVAVDSSGEAVNATDTASDKVVGRAAEYVDNSADGKVITVDIGIFGWAKSGTISDANIGDIVYVVDNQTVATADPGNGCIAGIVVEQDSSYAYVDTTYLPRTAGSFTTLSASGAATLGSTLGVTGAATLSSTVAVTGAQTNSSTLKVGGAVSCYSTLGVTGAATFAGNMTITPTSLTVTNGQVITVGAGSYVIDSVGGADDSTNTVTVTAPAAAGQLVILAMATATTNLLTIADSGTFAGSSALLLDANDAAILFSVDTSTWLEIPGDN